MRDFAPISLAAEINNCLVVHPSLPVKTVKELIAFAKARPGQLNYASGVPGFEFESWTGFLAPAGTPPEVIARVNAEVVHITKLPETNDRLPALRGSAAHRRSLATTSKPTSPASARYARGRDQG